MDKIRVRRIMTLLKGLDERGKKVFFSLQVRQLNMKNLVAIYVGSCEEYNVSHALGIWGDFGANML